MSINIEQLLISALQQLPALDGVPVVADVPKHRPARFITVERTGGGRADLRDLPVVTLHAWDVSRYDASRTALVLADAIEALAVTDPAIGRASIESIYNDPDSSGHPRYRVTAQIVTIDA